MITAYLSFSDLFDSLIMDPNPTISADEKSILDYYKERHTLINEKGGQLRSDLKALAIANEFEAHPDGPFFVFSPNPIDGRDRIGAPFFVVPYSLGQHMLTQAEREPVFYRSFVPSDKGKDLSVLPYSPKMDAIISEYVAVKCQGRVLITFHH